MEEVPEAVSLAGFLRGISGGDAVYEVSCP